jgi:hypothetical protein
MKYRTCRSALNALAPAALAGLICACAGSGPATRTDVEDDGTVTQRMMGNEIGLEGEGEYSDFAMGDTETYIEGQVRYCTLDLGRRAAEDGTVRWIFFLGYTGPQKLVIERRKSMEVLVDGKYRSVLVGQGSPERSENRIEGSFTESYAYEVPAGVLDGITTADDVVITVTGGEFTLRAYLTADNIARFREFFESHGGRVE